MAPIKMKRTVNDKHAIYRHNIIQQNHDIDEIAQIGDRIAPIDMLRRQRRRSAVIRGDSAMIEMIEGAQAKMR